MEKHFLFALLLLGAVSSAQAKSEVQPCKLSMSIGNGAEIKLDLKKVDSAGPFDNYIYEDGTAKIIVQEIVSRGVFGITFFPKRSAGISSSAGQNYLAAQLYAGDAQNTAYNLECKLK